MKKGSATVTRRQFLGYGMGAVAAAAALRKTGVCAGILRTGDRVAGPCRTGEGRGEDMIKASKIGEDFKERLAMRYSPVGFYFTDRRPDDAHTLKRPWAGCIMPLILASAKGRTHALDKTTIGRDCSAFFLGYKDWIFPGIEYFVSHAPLVRSLGEGFVQTSKLAKQYLESIRFTERSKGYAVFKPLTGFADDEKPEVVIFFANPDQLGALVYLTYYAAPLEHDRVVAGFASGCGSVVTLPLQYARKGQKKAVWGLHDISARANLPPELMTLTVPYGFLVELWKEMTGSFLDRDSWKVIRKRIPG
jgi:uncharacterized protein (DUF169 family)